MDVAAAVATVAPVCEQVRTRGAAAVRELTRRLDGVDLATTRVPQQRLDGALASLDPGVREALQEAARRARLVHEAQVPAETTTRLGEGAGHGAVPAGRPGRGVRARRPCRLPLIGPDERDPGAGRRGRRDRGGEPAQA